MAYATKPHRPIGVAILAILVILAGVLLTLLGLLAVVAALVLAPALLIVTLIFLVLALVLLASGIGLWNMRGWAWWLAVIVLILEIVVQVSDLGLLRAGGFSSLTTGQMVSFAILVLVLIYLFAVRGSFKAQTTAYVPPPPK